MRLAIRRRLIGRGLLAALLFLGHTLATSAGEPDPKTYWDIEAIRPGMKGTGQTVMVGTKLEEFGAEVLGVMRGVSPGRDMVLCRLTGCNLEHAGIIQGMSGSPIYIDGKLLGAVAFAWEFAKDPIAGVTPFQQMVQYVRASDKRIAAEAKDPTRGEPVRTTAAAAAGLRRGDLLLELDDEPVTDASDLQRLMVHERIGREVRAIVLRDGRERTIELVLDELT